MGGVHFSQWQGLICDGKSLCQTASRVQSYFCLFQGSSGVSQNSFGFLCSILWKTPYEIFSQPNTFQKAL